MKAFTQKELSDTKEALHVFSKLARKSCLAYEFVALKLGCSPDRASLLVVEVNNPHVSAAGRTSEAVK